MRCYLKFIRWKMCFSQIYDSFSNNFILCHLCLSEHRLYASMSIVTDRVVISLMIRGEHGIQCVPCSSRLIIEMLPEPEIHTIEIKVFFFTRIYDLFSNNFMLYYLCLVEHRLYASMSIVTDRVVISLMIQVKHGIQYMTCPPRIISGMLPEIHTMDKCVFLKSMIHSQIILFSIICAWMNIAGTHLANDITKE